MHTGLQNDKRYVCCFYQFPVVNSNKAMNRAFSMEGTSSYRNTTPANDKLFSYKKFSLRQVSMRHVCFAMLSVQALISLRWVNYSAPLYESLVLYINNDNNKKLRQEVKWQVNQSHFWNVDPNMKSKCYSKAMLKLTAVNTKANNHSREEQHRFISILGHICPNCNNLS